MMVNDTSLYRMVPSKVQIQNKHVETELPPPTISAEHFRECSGTPAIFR